MIEQSAKVYSTAYRRDTKWRNDAISRRASRGRCAGGFGKAVARDGSPQSCGRCPV